MAKISTDNICEPIAAGRLETRETQSQQHSRLHQVPLAASQADPDQAAPTKPFPSINVTIPSTPTDSPHQHTLLTGQTLSDTPITYFQEGASLNLNFQDIWEESMEGIGSTGTPHKKTAVLMISWSKELDELDTGPEVKELAEVFRNEFKYDVVEAELTAKNLPKKQLAVHLAKFIRDFDTESTLLIIYYAGHGIPGPPGELYFASKKTDKRRTDEKNSIPWHKIEAGLQLAVGDILLIFDCCYAGNLDMHFDGRGHWASRSFELLAACKHDAKTHPPGPKSFTKALIWALKCLLEKRQIFSTHELQMKIPHAEGFPANQGVRIIERGDPSDHRLVLAAVPHHSDATIAETDPVKPPMSRPKRFIDLRFWYAECPDEDEVKELSSRLKQLLLHEHIKADRIGWTRLGNVDQVRNVLEKWRGLAGLRPRQSSTTLPRIVIPHSSLHTRPQPSYISLPSHSESSGVSDAYIQAGDVFLTSINVPETIEATGSASVKGILTVDDAGIEALTNQKNLSLALSSDLYPESESLPRIISFNSHISDTAVLLSVASLSCLISFGLCKYFFNEK